jgi:hypothetical protein
MAWRAICLVEVELELEGGATLLEVVEGVVEGPAAAAAALRLGVQRVHARVELRALLRVSYTEHCSRGPYRYGDTKCTCFPSCP